MTMSLTDAAQPGRQAKKPYAPPQLTVFGPLSKLTQNGTGTTNENNGKGICGPGFSLKGGSNC